MNRPTTREGRVHLAETHKIGRDFHACPVCGVLYECEAVIEQAGCEARHFVHCATHGQQAGIGGYYVHPRGRPSPGMRKAAVAS